MKYKAWGLALLVVIAWGFNFVVIHWGLEELPPLLLGGLRFLFVAFPAVLFLPRPNLPLRWLLAYALTISFGQFALLFSAIQLGMPAGLASVVLQIQAVFTLLMAMMFLSESLKMVQWIAISVALCGLVLLSIDTEQGMTLIGLILTLAAAFCWAAGNIISRKLIRFGDLNLVGLVVWAGLIPPIPFLAASYWLEGPELIISSLEQATMQSVWVLAYLALIASVFGYGVWAYLLKNNPASQVAPLTLFVPVTGLLSAWIFLDERLTTLQWLGICTVFAGLLLNSFGYLLWQRLRRLR